MRKVAAGSRLAVETYAAIGRLDDGDDLLNLAWTSDERAWLAGDLNALMARRLEAELGGGLALLNSYRVQDPYGQAVLAPCLPRALPVPTGVAVFAGAGAGPLVQAMAGLARTAPVRVAGDVYPDFPYWVEQALGRPVKTLGRDFPSGGVAFLEHPSLTIGSEGQGVEVLCARAQAAGGLVVVDESNANYLAPADSAARLIGVHANLVVIRGFSKAYGLGGLRLGLALCAPQLAPRLRTCIAPLLASPLALDLGAAILQAGDLAAPLRARVAQVRQRIEPVVARLPLDLAPVDPRLPYLLFHGDVAAAVFEARGVRGKTHRYWSAAQRAPASYYRLSLPLEEGRLRDFLARLAA